MHPMSTEDFLREIVFGNNGNASSSGTFLSGASGPMPPQAAGWQSSAPRQSLLGSPQAGATGTGSSGFGTGLFRMRCTTNQHGKIEAKEEQTPTESTRWEYTYDVAGHLATVRCNGKVTEEYTYNAQGQRIADRVPEALRHRGGQRRFSYNYEGQLVEVNSTRYLYTASGTLRGKQEGSKNTYFSYGDDTRLDNVTVPSGFEVRYEYGQSLLPERIHVSGRLVEEYRWHGQLQLHEYYDVMQDTRYTFQYKGERVPAGVHISGTGAAFIRERFQRGNLDQYSPMFQAQGATDSLFLHIGADQVGSIRTLSTDDGRMVKEITYDSFGNVLRDSFPQLSFPLGFAGGLVDEHTGFVRFGYRDYDPQTGRFTAQDPARDLRGDADLYDYCVDDPVSCIDPQGLRFTEAEASSGGASHKGISHAFGAPHSESTEGKPQPPTQEEEDAKRQSKLKMTDAEFEIHKNKAIEFAGRYPVVQPVLEDMARFTKIPLQLLVGIAILEGGLKTRGRNNAKSSFRGMFQVGNDARKAVAPKTDEEKAKRTEIIEKYGDSSLYDGPMYAKLLLQKKGIDPTASPEKVALDLYKGYLMGPEGSFRFGNLSPDATVDEALKDIPIKSNASYFMNNGVYATKQHAEKKLQEYVNKFMDQANYVLKSHEKKISK